MPALTMGPTGDAEGDPVLRGDGGDSERRVDLLAAHATLSVFFSRSAWSSRSPEGGNRIGDSPPESVKRGDEAAAADGERFVSAVEQHSGQMGGRSSKTKPAASLAKTQDTVVETFDMGGVDGAAEIETLKQGHIHEIEETHSAHATNAHKGGTVSSSEEEDGEPEGDETRHTAKNRKRPREKKKPPKSLPTSDKSKLTLSSLRPVKPLHPLSKQSPVERVKTPLPTVAADSDKPPSTPPQGQDMPTNKPESPSRFFGFKVRRNSIRSDASSTRENKTVSERSTGSPEKAVSASPHPKITGGASLERFIEWRDGTCRSSGRDSSTRNSETPEDDAEDQVEQSSDKVEDFDELERETASALSSPPPRTVRFMMLAKHIQTDQAKASEKRTPVPSPSMSVESQRSSRSGGRNLNTDNVDETIVNNILAEAIE